MTGAEFDAAMRTLATKYQFSETSGRRTAKHNKDVGGKVNSRHVLGLARDCIFDDPLEIPAFRLDVKRLGLKYSNESDHIHVQAP
jgi:hypothetical protein